MLRLLFLLIVVFFELQCNTPHASSVTQPNNAPQATDSSSAFKLLDAKYENAVSGYNGVRSTEYYFTISILTEDKLQFDSLWINGERHAIFFSKASGTISNIIEEPKKGDNLILRVSVLNSTKKQAIEPPFEYNGKALLRYQIGTSLHHFVVKEIKLQTTPNRS